LGYEERVTVRILYRPTLS